MTTYNYLVSIDFINQKINVSSLSSEITSNIVVTTQLDHIDLTDGENVDIVFQASLTTAEKTELDIIVAAHQGDTIDLTDPIESININIDEIKTRGQTLRDSRETAGKMVEKEFILDISASIGWTYKYIVFPFDIDLISGTYESLDAVENDKVKFSVLPPEQSTIKGLIGQTDVVTSSGTNEIILPTGMAAYFDDGTSTITLIDGANVETRLVSGADLVNNKVFINKISETSVIDTSDSLTISFPIGSLVVLERLFAEHTFIGPRRDVVGETSWGSSTILKNYILKAGFYNSTNSTKKIRFIMSYFCGKYIA